MPVTALPEDSTYRGYIHYTSGGLPHTASFRFGAGVTNSEATAALNTIGEKMLALMDSGDAILGGEYSVAGSNIRFPLPSVTTGNGTASGAVNNDINRSVSLGLSGKGATGHIVVSRFFTLLGAAYTDTRLPYSSLASNVQEWFDAIRSNEDRAVVDIDDQIVGWNAYLNVARDAYWQRKQR